MKTITEVPFEKVPEIMDKLLPDNAYKGVQHRDFLTDTNPAYLFEIATEVFGLCGYGWFYSYDPCDIDVIAGKDSQGKPRFSVTIKLLELRFKYLDKTGAVVISEPIPSPGGSTNSQLEDALKGAVTNCLGKAFSRLCWQLSVYKGERSHKQNGKRKRTTTTKKKQTTKKKAPPKWSENDLDGDDLKKFVEGMILPPDAVPKHLINLLNLSPFKPGDDLYAPNNWRWFQLYRGQRDQQTTPNPKQATLAATQAWTANVSGDAE